MKVILPVDLASHIIVREECEGFLLFNGSNSALVSVRKADYASLMSSEHTLSDDMLLLYGWLHTSGFLAGDDVVINGDTATCTLEDPGTEIFDEFFDLRSEVNPLHVLWAITPRCNLRCIYCFPNAYAHAKKFRTPPIESLRRIAEQLILSRVLKVTISGGECLLAQGMWSIVRSLKNAGIRVTLLSNGTIIDNSILDMIQTYQVTLGISLDAPNEQTNAITRGPGAFQKTVNAIDAAVRAGIRIAVLVTLTCHNFPFLDEHLSLLENLGVRVVTIQDLRPFGTKVVYDQHRLTAIQEMDLRDRFAFLKAKHPSLLIYPTELFIFSKEIASGHVMNCPAGDNNAYIDFFGYLYPCTSLPSFRMGNLHGDLSLTELWQQSKAITTLRQLKKTPLDALSECSACSNKLHCEGGCRGDALFYSGELLGLPSRCPKRLGLCT